MSLKLATKIVQGILGLTFQDAVPFVRNVRGQKARQERVNEIKLLAEKIPQLSDGELELALSVYR